MRCNVGASRRAWNHFDVTCALFSYNDWAGWRKRPFQGSNKIAGWRRYSKGIGHIRWTEVVHLIIEDDSSLGRHHYGSKTAKINLLLSVAQCWKFTEKVSFFTTLESTSRILITVVWDKKNLQMEHFCAIFKHCDCVVTK